MKSFQSSINFFLIKLRKHFFCNKILFLVHGTHKLNQIPSVVIQLINWIYRPAHDIIEVLSQLISIMCRSKISFTYFFKYFLRQNVNISEIFLYGCSSLSLSLSHIDFNYSVNIRLAVCIKKCFISASLFILSRFFFVYFSISHGRFIA